ncbi:MAG: hypothetical protein ACPGWR_00560 [Ardenticatenaceae bacterium]
MYREATPTGDELVGALNQLEVHFLSGEARQATLSPAQLIAGLAMQANTRMRLALIPLLLSHPNFAPDAKDAASALSGTVALNLKLFYTAAMLLQHRYNEQLDKLLGKREPLPDWFSQELGISLTDFADGQASLWDKRLKELGERHKVLLGVKANWAGTYHHGAKRLIKRLRCEIEWGVR